MHAKASNLTAPGLAALSALKRQLEQEPDVRRVLELAPLPAGRVRYLIETPFETFPRFAVGTCDLRLEAVQIELTCGAEATAREFFDAQMTTNEKQTQ
jgi:HPt (histidine-containing phosphotransfer) domain-containing protein